MMKLDAMGMMMASMPMPHLQPMPEGATTDCTMKAEIQGMKRKGKKEAEMARPLHLADVTSAMMISFMMFVPDWPTQL